VKAQFEISDGCAPYDAFFNNTTLAGQTFIWDFGDGSPVSNDMNPAHLYTDTGTYTISLLALDPNTCNLRDSTKHTIHVYPKPSADFTTQPPAQYNTPTVFANNSSDAVLLSGIW
jgi:PKD repeat protein